MINGQKLIVVMPAFNAAATLERTLRDVPEGLVDDFLLVDDASQDATVAEAERLGIPCIIHPENRGYGGNQKTCYAEALARGADIVVMLHPDYQYSPRLLGAMAWLVGSGEFDVVLGSRILGTGALKGGMPLYKYAANRLLTAVENLLLGAKLSEYHTGYRAFSKAVLTTLPLHECSDDFVFDNQMLVQALAFGFRIGEISCPTRYFPEASSIGFGRSVVYGCGVLGTAFRYRMHRWHLRRDRLFRGSGARAAPGASVEKEPPRKLLAPIELHQASLPGRWTAAADAADASRSTLQSVPRAASRDGEVSVRSDGEDDRFLRSS